MSGIVEELFIANDSSGTSQVWFRNWSVTASLNLRSQLNADPESVKWGATKDKFVVRTGATGAVQRYYLFHIPRAVNTIFGAGVIPAALLDRSYTPYTSPIVLVAGLVHTVYTLTKTIAVEAVLPLDRDRDPLFPNPCFYANPGSTTADTQVNTDENTGSGTTNVTLANVLAGGGSVRDYVLNEAGELILFVSGAVPSGAPATTRTRTQGIRDATTCVLTADVRVEASTGTTSPRSGESNGWIVNMLKESVLFDTVRSSPKLQSDVRSDNNNQPFIVYSAQDVVDISGAPGSALNVNSLNPACGGGRTCNGAMGAANGAPEGSGTVALGTFEAGTAIQIDTLWDTTLGFVTGVDYAPSSALVAKTQTNGTNFVGPDINQDSHTFTWNLTSNWTRKVWSLDTPYTYSVVKAAIVDTVAPLKFLMVLSRVRVDGSGTQFTLIHMRVDGSSIRILQDWSSNQITLLTATKRHAIWYQSGVVYMTAYDLDINGRTRQIGTSVTNAQARRYRLMYPEALLWQGQESSNASPAGTFLDAWEANGTPMLDDSAPAIFIPLDDFDTLAIVPAGISLPVLPTN